jgi:hypothetical protein
VNELEQALRALEVDWPETPDLAAAVSARHEPRRRFGWRRRLAVAVATLAVLFGGTLAVSPAARTDVLRWLGLKSVEIKREVPRPRPGATLNLGTPTTVAALRAKGVPVLVAKGEPDVYETTLFDGTLAASLVYPGPILVQTFRASARAFIQKAVASADAVEAVRVPGRRGYFITGAHGFAYQRGRNVNYEEQRIAGNTLLLEGGGLLLRIEGSISRDRALAIARSVE